MHRIDRIIRSTLKTKTTPTNDQGVHCDQQSVVLKVPFSKFKLGNEKKSKLGFLSAAILLLFISVMFYSLLQWCILRVLMTLFGKNYMVVE